MHVYYWYYFQMWVIFNIMYVSVFSLHWLFYLISLIIIIFPCCENNCLVCSSMLRLLTNSYGNMNHHRYYASCINLLFIYENMDHHRYYASYVHKNVDVFARFWILLEFVVKLLQNSVFICCFAMYMRMNFVNTFF